MRPGRFAFLVYPYRMADLASWYGLPKPPGPWLEMLEPLLLLMPSLTLSRLVDIISPHNEAAGWLVGCSLTARQMETLAPRRVLNKLVAAGRRAQLLGARILGLGGRVGLAGHVADGLGQSLDIAVTNGNTYTVSAALEATMQMAQQCGHDPHRASFAVIGGTTGAGSAAARIMARHVRRLTLVGNNQVRLQHLAHRILKESGLVVELSLDPRRVAAEAHVLVSFDGDAGARIAPASLRPNTVVCDVMPPPTLALKIQAERRDMAVLTGGLVAMPGAPTAIPRRRDLMNGTGPGLITAALAETIILSLEERYEPYSLGTGVVVERIDEIRSLAAKHGFRVVAPRSAK